MQEWDHPPFFWVFNSPSPASQGPMDPRWGGWTSADIVPTQIKFGVDASTRCWDIAQKPPKCKNFPLTPIVTNISFPHFSVRRGPLTPKRGEDTFWTRIRPHGKLGLNRPADCREIVDRTNKNKCVSKTDTNPPFAFQIAFPRGTDFTGFVQGGSKSRDLQSEISVRIESRIE